MATHIGRMFFASIALVSVYAVIAQPGDPSAAPKPAQPAVSSASSVSKAVSAERIKDAIARTVELLLARQEDMDAGENAAPETKAEWPYEGVYRVNRQIPIGYRIGGTAIAATCLLRAPDYDKDPKRQDAIARSVRFICEESKHPLMSAENYDADYDVRGWGYTYALAFFLELKSKNAIPTEPKETAERVESTIKWAISALARTEIPQVGGWNYARPPGKENVAPASPFMTGPTLQALFEARKQGYAVDEAVMQRAIAALERCRGSTGSFAYAAQKEQKPDRPEPVPGSVGRMLVGEVVLNLAGKSDVARVRGALDAFITHWQWLDQRRAKPGTHEGPYMIAPYYFYYAHYYAAQAIEMLPRNDRAEYRRRLADLLFSVRAEDGSWNDRVFPRTAAYGTSIAAMSLMMPSSPAPARLSENPLPSSQPH